MFGTTLRMYIRPIFHIKMEKGKEKEKVALSSFKLGVPLMGPFFFGRKGQRVPKRKFY